MSRHCPFRSSLLLLGWLLLYGHALAQQGGRDDFLTKADSIIRSTERISDDTSRIDSLVKLSDGFLSSDYNMVVSIAGEARRLSQAASYQQGLGKSLYLMAAGNYRLGNIDTATILGRQCIKLCEETEMTAEALKGYTLLANIHSKGNDLDEALELYNLVITKASELNDTAKWSAGLINLGHLLRKLGRPAGAKGAYLSADRILKRKPIARNQLALYTSIVHLIDDRDSVADYLSKAIALSEETNNQRMLAYAYKTLGYFQYNSWRQFEDAKGSLERALAISQDMGLRSNILDVSTLLSDLYIKSNEPAKAISMLENHIDELKGTGHESYLQQAYDLISTALAMEGNHREAYSYLLLHREISDSLYTNDLNSQLAEFEARYETEEKEKEIAIQKLEIERQQRLRALNAVYFMGILLLAGGLFQWYYSKQKLKKREAELALKEEHRETIRLRELDEFKSRFFTNLSHELKTPLTLITGPINDLRRSSAIDSETRQALDMASRNGEKLLSFVNEVLQLAKLESGGVVVNESAVPLKLTLSRIFHAFNSLAEIEGVQLIDAINVDPSISVKIDVDKLEMVFNNLISNAIKYTPPGGWVKMTAEVEEINDEKLRLQVHVRDNGAGIAVVDQKRIFDPYFQTSTTKGSERGGVGLGLALASQLVELMGGEMEVESEEGEGSVFGTEFSLSRSMDSVYDVSQIKEKTLVPDFAASLGRDRHQKVLIVEDNQDLVDYMTSILSKHFVVKRARDGVEGLRMLQKESFDLVTSDVMMPRMDGFEFREKMNEMDRIKHIPFIYVTARGFDEDKLLGLSLGVDDYITKPFNSRELMARVSNLLKNRYERSLSTDGSDDTLSHDEKTIRVIERVVYDRLDDTTLKTSDLAKSVNVSERQLRRVLKGLTGFSPVEFILEIRLQMAYHFLRTKKFNTVAEAMYAVGIESASYFSKKFADRFGVKASDV